VHTSAVTESPVVWRMCQSEHVQITLNKTWKLPPCFSLGASCAQQV